MRAIKIKFNPTFYKISSIFIVLIFLSSCVFTKLLWDKSYTENFRQFLVSQDGTMVVFLGSRYHYIFTDNTGILKSILSWHGRRNLFINTEETRMSMDNNNILTGHVTVESFFSRLPPQDYEFLRAIGFRSEDSFSPLKIKLMMKGKRYLPRSDLGYNLPKLERSYLIPIHYESDTIGKIGQIALTPISVAADSTLIIGKILLAPFRGQ